MFSSLQDFVPSNSVDTKKLFLIMSQHLKELAIKFCLYFSENMIFKKKIFGLLINFFTEEIKSCNLNAAKKKSLFELFCDTKLKIKT